MVLAYHRVNSLGSKIGRLMLPDADYGPSVGLESLGDFNVSPDVAR